MRQAMFPSLPYDEYLLRINKGKEFMGKYDIDALLLFGIDNIRYYTGHIKASYGFSRRWRRGVVIPMKGDPIFVSNNVTARNAMLTIWIEDVRPWGGLKEFGYPKDHEPLFIEIIKDFGARRVGVEIGDTMQNEISWGEFETIKKGLKDIEWVDAADLIWEQRMIKTEYEQSVIRDLHAKFTKAILRAREQLKPGMTEFQFHGLIFENCVHEGIHEDPMAGRMMMVGPGRYKAGIMGATDTVLKNGDTLFIDGGPRHKGYFMDIQRNMCFGKPTERMKDYYRVALEATLACASAVKPGVMASHVWDAGEKALKEMGQRYLSNRASEVMGHGMGLYTHEPPFFSSKISLERLGEVDRELKAGMYVAVEVGLLDNDPAEPEFVKMYPEENLLVTKAGYEVLTKDVPNDLWVIK
ncbi:MAG: Xaa-Pro peptidase family protein [Deltaproteobacteria bacterium]